MQGFEQGELAGLGAGLLLPRAESLTAGMAGAHIGAAEPAVQHLKHGPGKAHQIGILDHAIAAQTGHGGLIAGRGEHALGFQAFGEFSNGLDVDIGDVEEAPRRR